MPPVGLRASPIGFLIALTTPSGGARTGPSEEPSLLAKARFCAARRDMPVELMLRPASDAAGSPAVSRGNAQNALGRAPPWTPADGTCSSRSRFRLMRQPSATSTSRCTPTGSVGGLSVALWAGSWAAQDGCSERLLRSSRVTGEAVDSIDRKRSANASCVSTLGRQHTSKDVLESSFHVLSGNVWV